ncbi:MAG: pimeloyl-ACP methyl ester carboxylesterase [Cognaticolwellia sp.]|jgi:pimeloyl-ACP methyl ester carboxylesterase
MSRLKSILKVGGVFCLAGLIGLPIASAVYQASAQASDQAAYSPPGALFEVQGTQMHLLCMGDGEPTLVFESGLLSDIQSWDVVQPAISQTTRACSYDRSGLGYSEPVDHPQQAAEVAQRLHSLLSAAGIEGDMVLVGASIGGLQVRQFAHQFPERVSGMVLVDSSHEQQVQRFGDTEAEGPSGILKVASLLAPIGMLRLSGFVEMKFEESEISGQELEQAIAMQSQTHIPAAMTREVEAMKADMDANQPPPSLGDIPLIVLTQGLPLEEEEDFDPLDLEKIEEDKVERPIWSQLQLELSQLSSQGTQVFAMKSDHHITDLEPELVISSIESVLETVRDSDRVQDDAVLDHDSPDAQE